MLRAAVAEFCTFDSLSAAIETIGEVFASSERPLIVMSGFLQITGEKVTEQARPPVMPEFPHASEQTAFELVLAQ